jgi:hypothetical protein
MHLFAFVNTVSQFFVVIPTIFFMCLFLSIVSVPLIDSGFGGLVVSMLASGTQDHGFAPCQSCRIFSGERILSVPSFGREIKLFAPCRRFVACQRTLKLTVEFASYRLNYRNFSPASVPLQQKTLMSLDIECLWR